MCISFFIFFSISFHFIFSYSNTIMQSACLSLIATIFLHTVIFRFCVGRCFFEGIFELTKQWDPSGRSLLCFDDYDDPRTWFEVLYISLIGWKHWMICVRMCVCIFSPRTRHKVFYRIFYTSPFFISRLLCTSSRWRRAHGPGDWRTLSSFTSQGPSPGTI